MTKKLKFVFKTKRKEKGENTGHQYLLLIPQCFKKSSFSGSLKAGMMWQRINSLPNNKFLNLSKLKEVADDNFIFDENCRKFSKWVENIVGKGKIACNEQFVLFSHCFQMTSIPDR